MTTWARERKVRYGEFRQSVRRHAPSELLPVLAEIAVSQKDFEFDSSWRHVAPWAIAAVARESMLYGNEFRTRPVSDRALRQIFSLFNQANSGIPQGDDLILMMNGFFYEQFHYQDSPINDLARTYLLLIDTKISSDRSFPERDWKALLGLSLEESMQTTFAIFVAAKSNNGAYDPTWPERDKWSEIHPSLNPGKVNTTVQRLTCTVEQAKGDNDKVAKVPAHLERFGYNPLTATPLVDLGTGRFIAPQFHLILRTMLIESLYYQACSEWGVSFAEELGLRVEAYTGRQLQYAGFETVRPEIEYGRDRRKSVDWFVVTDKMVVLFECKSAKLPLDARAGSRKMVDILDRAVGKARKQIKNSADLIRSKHRDFHEIPDDRKMLGVIITAEPIYCANDPEFYDQLPNTGIPTIAVSLKELEILCQLGSKRMLDVLVQIVDHPEFITWSVENAIREIVDGSELTHNNGLVEDAFDKFVMPLEYVSKTRNGTA
jgi:hypothetical protein